MAVVEANAGGEIETLVKNLKLALAEREIFHAQRSFGCNFCATDDLIADVVHHDRCFE